MVYAIKDVVRKLNFVINIRVFNLLPSTLQNSDGIADIVHRKNIL